MASGDFIWEEFRKEWLTLPPLVRASITAAYAKIFAEHAQIERAKADWLLSVNAGRRSMVSRRFGTGQALLSEMLLKLTVEADDEATARGIDADITAVAAPKKKRRRK